MSRYIVMGLCCLAGAARASGFYLGDNGAKAMVQAGAFVAQADDGTAIQYNPAGLARQRGVSFLADLQVLRQDVSFFRHDPGSPDALSNTVANKKEPFLLGFFAASYGLTLAERNFNVGLGIYSAPAQGRNVFPTPNYRTDAFAEPPNTFAPQRHALISNDMAVAYPTLALAWELHPRFQIGVSAQLVLSRFQQTQVMYRGDAATDNPDLDATISVDLTGQIGFTGIFGVMAQPTDWLSIGASFRPPVPIKARGKMSVSLSEAATTAGARVSGDDASLQLTLPMEARLGARMMPLPGPWNDRLSLNFDLVYQGWNSIDQLRVVPENVTVRGSTNAEPIPLAALGGPRNWHPTLSVRAGTSFRVLQHLSLHAGTSYETGAAPSSTSSVDWANPGRFILTGGLTGHFGPISLIAGGLYSPTVTTEVSDSVLRGGNGTYTSGAWGLLFGVRANFTTVEEGRTPPARSSTAGQGIGG